MKHSESRILTTHAASLPRPDELLPVNLDTSSEPERDPSAHRQRLRAAVQEVVRRQIDLGIAVVNDGEYGKAMRAQRDYGAWLVYVMERLTGFEAAAGENAREPAPSLTPSIKPRSFYQRRDRLSFPEVYAEIDQEMYGGRPRPTGRAIVAAITYKGQEALQADIDHLRAALEGRPETEAFMTSVAPGSFGREQNHYYPTQEEFLFAIADAMRIEYRAIVDAGFILQIDDPGMAENWDAMDPAVTIEQYRQYASLCIAVLNHALEGLLEDRVRYHMCWGSWHGPHLSDIPLRCIVDLLLTVRAGAFSVEAGNVRHEHEWKVWRDVKLPAGKILIPGVVSHATNVVEHPELVADRIVQYAELVGRENVIAGTDCGLGGRIHPSLAWAKLQALVEGAELASRSLWS